MVGELHKLGIVIIVKEDPESAVKNSEARIVENVNIRSDYSYALFYI